MSDKIEEIRARHEAGERANAAADREWLLAEVERLTRERDDLLDEVESLCEALDEALEDGR